MIAVSVQQIGAVIYRLAALECHTQLQKMSGAWRARNDNDCDLASAATCTKLNNHICINALTHYSSTIIYVIVR